MIVILIVILTIFFAIGSISPLLVTEEMQDMLVVGR